MAAWINAEKKGRCSNCSKQIEKEDLIYLRGKTVLCEECGLLAANTSDAAGPIESATQAQIDALPAEAANNPLAQMALWMSRQLDLGDVGARDAGNFTKEIRLNYLQLRDLYPGEEDEDDTDIARRKREQRMREQGGF